MLKHVKHIIAEIEIKSGMKWRDVLSSTDYRCVRHRLEFARYMREKGAKEELTNHLLKY